MKNGDLPAFGHVAMTDTNGYQTDGLSKREYFAAMAMQGLLSNPDWMKSYNGEKYLFEDDVLAKVALSSSDALLSELEKPIQNGQ